MKKHLLYFAYGSNMTLDRMQKTVPGSEFVAIGVIINYDFGFGDYISENWNGAPATIYPKKGSMVWGAVWRIPVSGIAPLDTIEGVAAGIYNRLYVPVMVGEEEVFCYTFMMVAPVSDSALPSVTYLEEILNSAERIYLPIEYLTKLRKFNSNGKVARKKILSVS